MSRKRSRKEIFKKTATKVKKIVKKPKIPTEVKKTKVIIPVILIAGFILCLMLNAYFNFSSGVCINPEGTTVGTKYYLSGPDPYYNLRTIVETIKNDGVYVYTTEVDPLLNYPIGNNGARPPLFNMIAVFSSSILEQIGVPQIDAIGLVVLFLPSIYGALLIFPVYLIGKELFSEKVGVISAILLPLIPVHIGSGHGSALSLFDHDSFILLLVTIMFFFIIKMLKEQDKIKACIYSIFAGICLGSISLTWVASHLLYIMLAIFVFVNLYFEFIKSTKSCFNSLKFVILFSIAFLLSLPYYLAINLLVYFPLIILLFSIVILTIHYIILKKQLPWLLSIPVNLGVFSLVILFLKWSYDGILPNGMGNKVIYQIASVLFGGGLYASKVEMTIAEGSTYGLSALGMLIGPSLLWLGLIGFVFLIYKTYMEKLKTEYTFYLLMFLISFILLTQAGRFINDLVPFFAVLSSFTIVIILSKCKYPNILKEYTSDFKWYHITAIFGVFLTLIGPFVFIDNQSPLFSTIYLLIQTSCILTFIPIIENYKNHTYIGSRE